jgi:hypothetical protein
MLSATINCAWSLGGNCYSCMRPRRHSLLCKRLGTKIAYPCGRLLRQGQTVQQARKVRLSTSRKMSAASPVLDWVLSSYLRASKRRVKQEFMRPLKMPIDLRSSRNWIVRGFRLAVYKAPASCRFILYTLLTIYLLWLPPTSVWCKLMTENQCDSIVAMQMLGSVADSFKNYNTDCLGSVFRSLE